MTPERFQRIKNVLDQRQSDLTLIIDQIHKGRNLSAIIRSADAHGIDKVHCIEPEAGFKHYRGTALGSHKWVEVVQHNTAIDTIADLKKQNYKIVAAHLSDTAQDYQTIDYTQPIAIVLGKENTGVDKQTMACVDHHVTIPMFGMVESFNVSVACAILLAEARRQRMAKGMYQSRQLTDKHYKQRLFQWCQPQVTRFCDERHLPYPDLDDQGEIIDGPNWYRSINTGELT